MGSQQKCFDLSNHCFYELLAAPLTYNPVNSLNNRKSLTASSSQRTVRFGKIESLRTAVSSQLVAGTCVLASLVLIIVFRGITKRNSDYKLFVDTELSKAQLEQYNSYNDMQQEKKELKHKIKEAKDKGESFIELQKEYDEKFGKQAQKDKLKEAEEKDKESHTKAETEYKSILGDDNDEDSEVKDTDEKDTEEE